MKQQSNQNVFIYYSKIVFLKSHLFQKLKLNEIQQFSNFKNDFCIEHQKKLKNLFEKINLQNLIDQIMSFEKNEILTRTYKKNKFNSRIINNNEQKNIKENDSKRFRNEREENNREKNRNRKRNRDNSKNERDDHKENRENHNNFNNESIQKKT